MASNSTQMDIDRFLAGLGATLLPSIMGAKGAHSFFKRRSLKTRVSNLETVVMKRFDRIEKRHEERFDYVIKLLLENK